MIRRIIQIDEEKCNGCGACAGACHEGAIAIINGKARLTRDDYCDGLGDCLPACPMNAITFTERDAAAYDADAVARHKERRDGAAPAADLCGMLENWPVQLQLAPVSAPYYDGAELLIAADCTAYAYGGFHADFIAGRTALIACPKLDRFPYAEKLTNLFMQNNIRSITVTRMTVPCCGGLEHMVRTAIAACGKRIPLKVITIGIDGKIAREESII